MIPEIDIWRVADLMLKRYGDGLSSTSIMRMLENVVATGIPDASTVSHAVRGCPNDCTAPRSKEPK